ncbi:hypothetical protein [Streptomyces sp. NPDC020951]|uniref:hypothetical protein n=1 Tax=Streptomyces sp. NPDC020951 TaxID=3365104 RepID=UPI003791E673
MIIQVGAICYTANRDEIKTGLFDTLDILNEAPRTAVELVVEWKAVCAQGDIRLGTGRRGQDALVPYRVPVRLTFVAEVKDLPYRET